MFKNLSSDITIKRYQINYCLCNIKFLYHKELKANWLKKLMLIIGITGTKASGKGEIKRYLKAKHGFEYFTLSDILKQELIKRGKDNYTTKDLQDMGDEFRKKHETGILAEMMIEKIKQEKIEKSIIDGIRNPGEVEALRKIKNFYLISVDAPKQKRFELLLKRAKSSDPKTWQGFLEMEKRDLHDEQEQKGQQVAACMKLADLHIYNESDVEVLHKKVDEVLEKIDK